MFETFFFWLRFSGIWQCRAIFLTLSLPEWKQTHSNQSLCSIWEDKDAIVSHLSPWLTPCSPPLLTPHATIPSRPTVGTAVWSPSISSSSGCREPFPVWRSGPTGKGAGVGLAVWAFSPPSAPSCFTFSLSFSVSSSTCVLFFTPHLLTFYYLVVCTLKEPRHRTSAPPDCLSLLVSSYHPVTRYFPLTSNKQLLFFSWLELAFLFSLLYWPRNCCQMRCVWPDDTPLFSALVFFEYFFSKYNYLWNSGCWKAFLCCPNSCVVAPVWQ